MIKINHKDPLYAKNKYFDLLKLSIVNRLEILKISLYHLSGETVDTKDSKFTSIKIVTRKIIEITDPKKYPKNKFNKESYINTINNYIETHNNLSKINLQGLIDLTKFLLVENNLKKLIVCEAKDLENQRDGLLNSYSLHNDYNIQIIGLAFDYDFKEINTKIKQFFRDENFVKYCPYCNLKEVQYLETDSGKVGDVHELDHFFDKIKSPLLALSMYNLIPSDSTCNGINNKGSISFYDEFHLNPYISGAGEHLQFIPKLGSVGKVLRIHVSISNKELRFRKKLIGDCLNIDENCEQGNINVFKIKTKYKNRTNEADRVLNKINNEEKGRRSLKIFISKLKGLDINKNYINWYHENIETDFNPSNFHKERYSKFNRDIHDFYYSRNTKNRNKFIHELIKKNIG